MTEQDSLPLDSLKDQGNSEFKSGNFLKAAALYTKAIKAEPSNSVLYRYTPVLHVKRRQEGRGLSLDLSVATRSSCQETFRS